MALVHESKLIRNNPDPEASHRPMAYESGRPMSVIHSGHCTRAAPRLLALRGTGSKAIPDDQLAPEEGVLDPGLLMVGRGLLPPSPSDGLHLLDGAITRAGPGSAPGDRCGLGRPTWQSERPGGAPGTLRSSRTRICAHQSPARQRFASRESERRPMSSSESRVNNDLLRGQSARISRSLSSTA